MDEPNNTVIVDGKTWCEVGKAYRGEVTPENLSDLLQAHACLTRKIQAYMRRIDVIREAGAIFTLTD